MKLTHIRVVAEAQDAEGKTTFVDVAVRKRDLDFDIINLLEEKANGTYSDESLPDGFEHSDAVGG